MTQVPSRLGEDYGWQSSTCSGCWQKGQFPRSAFLRVSGLGSDLPKPGLATGPLPRAERWAPAPGALRPAGFLGASSRPELIGPLGWKAPARAAPKPAARPACWPCEGILAGAAPAPGVAALEPGMAMCCWA